MKNTVIFDLDGTLAHTAPSLGRAINILLEGMGRGPLDDGHLRAFIGNGAKKLVARTWEHFGITDDEATVDEGVSRFFECYAETCFDIEVYPDMALVIDSLRKKDVVLCVLSNKPDRFVLPIIEHTFGNGKFLFAEGAKEGIPHKPDPSSLIDMLSRAGSDGEHCVFVGDSEVDVEIARRAGCKCCAVDWGYRSRGVLIETGAQNIVSNAQELLSELERLLSL